MIENALRFLLEQSALSLVMMFWFPLVFEIPRYLISFFVGTTIYLFFPADHANRQERQKISIIIAGHNESASITKCVTSLHEQTLQDLEIIVVDDGSTDNMYKVLERLEQNGLIHKGLRCEIRGGKSAALNLAKEVSTGEIVINVDCDCSFERDAIAEIVKPFADERVGAVSGNVLPRNASATMITAFQAIEYLFGITLGRQSAVMMGQTIIISGAFAAFRRTAWDSVNGFAIGPGEDFDITLRLHQAGWKISFMPSALCMTDVPETMPVLFRQRQRWERDSIRLQFRKHIREINPFGSKFSWGAIFSKLDFLLLSVLAAFVFPFYMLYLFVQYGDMALTILIASTLFSLVFDIATLFFAVLIAGRLHWLWLLAYLPGYALFSAYIMRFVRSWAYINEWIFRPSEHDDFVPEKIRVWYE